MKNIEICKKCDGTGQVKSYIVNYHNCDDFEYVDCTNCKSTGRILKYEWQMELPFGSNINEINEVDSKIYNIIRELTKKNRIS